MQESLKNGAARTDRAHGRSVDDFEDLSDAEKELLKCARSGKPCRLNHQRPSEGDLYNTVRASLIRFLVLGGDGETPVHERGVDLRGAYVSGDLDFRGTRMRRSLRLENCCVNGIVDLWDAWARQVDLTNSRIGRLEAGGALVDGSVWLKDGFETVDGASFYGAVIDGNLDCSGGTFQTQNRYALVVENAKIKGSVLLRNGFQAYGQCVLSLAEIEGNLDCSGGKFINPAGEAVAIRADGIQIAGSVRLIEHFEAQGEVRFPVAKVDGDFLCSGGQFHRKGGDALILVGAEIGARLALGALREASVREIHVDGVIRLSEAQVRVLRWDGPGYIGGNWTTRIDGFTYERISGETAATLSILKGWLNKQHTDDLHKDFKPQPFEQLIKVLRDVGHFEDARRIGYDMQQKESAHQLRQSSFLMFPGVFLWRIVFLKLLVGYGYRPQRAIILAVLLWGISGYVFSEAARQGVIVPADPLLYAVQPQGGSGASLSEVCRGEWTACDDPRMQEYPNFNAYVYSADLILPIVSFDQEARWTPLLEPVAFRRDGETIFELPRWGTRFLVWFEIVYGWVAGLILAAVFSGAIRKE